MKKFFFSFLFFFIYGCQAIDNEPRESIYLDKPTRQEEYKAGDNTPASVQQEKVATRQPSKKAFYREQLDGIEEGLSDLAHFYKNGVTSELLLGEYETLKRWDDALNEMYQALQEEVAPNEMERLREEQRVWIKTRDEQALTAKNEYEGGSAGDLAYVGVLHQLTKERCYELLNYFPS